MDHFLANEDFAYSLSHSTITMKHFPFLPMSLQEIKMKGWDHLDVLIVSGDPYVDHPSYGVALIGRLLESHGYQVGIVAQPDWHEIKDFTRLGRPRLCACVTAGNVDSMIVNYTANKRKRRTDTTKVGFVGQCPDRATIVYTNRLRQAFKGLPIIIGGVEASLRRLAHYDYWDNDVRRSILVDSKADLLVYGMGEKPIVEIVDRLKQGESVDSIKDVRGTVVRVKKESIPADVEFIPSFEEIHKDHLQFNKAFSMLYQQMNPYRSRSVVQMHDDQCILQRPAPLPLTTEELDRTYALPFTRACHPFYNAFEGVRGFETVRWSITAVRGCPGECSFCGITMHQGRLIQSRSKRSILDEATRIAKDPDFKGTISDVGGPTANLYGALCSKAREQGPCANKQCLMPEPCSSLKISYQDMIDLYRQIKGIPKVKHVFIASGLRYDLLLNAESSAYLKEICANHISGQMKVAPEHTEDEVLALMNKPSYQQYQQFVKRIEDINRHVSKKTYLVNYFISAHPGSRLEDAFACALKLLSCRMRPEQIQDFIPLPMTVASCMYHTGVHPLTGQRVCVAKNYDERILQRALVQSQNVSNRPLIKKALRLLKKENWASRFGLK